MPPFVRLPLLLILVAALAACGFQPRGSHFDPGQLPQPLHLAGSAEHRVLERELRRQLRQAGVRLADTAETANAILYLIEVRSERRQLNLDARNRVAEYELVETLSYRLRRPDAQGAPAHTLRATRILRQTGKALLARQREERRLREEMRRELVRRLIARLASGR